MSEYVKLSSEDIRLIRQIVKEECEYAKTSRVWLYIMVWVCFLHSCTK
jgi:hypothetical protein